MRFISWAKLSVNYVSERKSIAFLQSRQYPEMGVLLLEHVRLYSVLVTLIPNLD